MNLINKLDSITTKKILVIGDVMIDKYYVGTSKRISPEAPVPVLLKKSEKFVLGGASNVAINIKKANQDVSILTVVGNDYNGELLVNMLNENNINTDLIIKDSERTTTVKNRFIGQNNMQMFRFDEETNMPVNNSITEKLYQILEEKIKEFDIVVISDYNKGLLTVENTSKIIDIANKYNVKTLIDVKEPNYNKYKNSYLIKPNLNELQELTNLKIENEEDIIKAGKLLLENTSCKHVLVTLGKDGMTLINNEEIRHFDCLSREVYDVTGAGDTVISYLAVGLSNNIELNNVIQIANYAAGVGVSKMGTYAVTIDEIKKYIKDENDTDYEEKIVTVDDLVEKLNEKRDKTIVFTNGCFDIFHVGHARYLKDASKLGDYLVVGVNSDSSVKRLKGEERPIVSENERMELLAALEFVSFVVMFDEDTPYNLISKIKPNIITKGGDYNPDEVVGKDIVESYGGKVVICPLVQGKSTTNIIEKIKGE